MKALKIISIIVVILSVIWHIMENSASTREVTGVFEVAPKKGYVWADAPYDRRSRFFWREASTLSWRPGQHFPGINVHMSTTEDVWIANPGYVITNIETRDTRWQPGMLHPDLKAFSGEIEGNWVAIFGYTFEKGHTFTPITVWTPWLKNDNLKLISSQNEGVYNAYPGYSFVNSQSLIVKWKPGLIHPDNAGYVSGIKEGTWEIKPTSESTDTYEELTHTQKWLAAGIASAVLEDVFGKGFLSNSFSRESDRQFMEVLKGN